MSPHDPDHPPATSDHEVDSASDLVAFADAWVMAKTGSGFSGLERALLKAAWSVERQSYDQIAVTCGYSAHYLRKHVGPKLWQTLSTALGEKVTKLNARQRLERLRGRQSHPPALSPPLGNTTFDSEDTDLGWPAPVGLPSSSSLTLRSVYQDWGEAVDVDIFYGRQAELSTLWQWVTTDRCRLVGIFGVGGMGKTHVSVKLARQLAEAVTSQGSVPLPLYDVVIWRSLRNGPPLHELLANLLQTFIRISWAHREVSTDAQLSQVMTLLSSHRCLLVLDNAETILQEGESAGHYRPGYENYGVFFKCMGETSHQSCLVINGREKPREFAVLEGEQTPVRSLYLKGLAAQSGHQLLVAKGLAKGVESTLSPQITDLVQRYGGNPLALKIVSATVQDLFDGDIAAFLQQDIMVVEALDDLLEQHFMRLTALEQSILYWLAMAREPISLSTLGDDLVQAPGQRSILDALKSLGQRSLIERHQGQFSIQPVIMEYLLDRLVKQVFEEIVQVADWETLGPDQPPILLTTQALIKAQAKDYVREAQIRLILKPLLDQLWVELKTQRQIAAVLTQMLRWQQTHWPLAAGYLAGNLLNLLIHMGADLSGYDCSNLTIWQAYLEGSNLRNVNFSYSDLSRSVLTETFASTLSVAFSPAGDHFATATTDNDICLWQTADGTKTMVYQGHTGWVHSVTFSPTGSVLASGSEDHTIRLWQVQTGQCLTTLRGHQSWVWAVVFSPDGQFLASSSNDQTVRLWDVETGTCINVFEGHQNWVWSVAFSPDGCLLASGSNDQTIKLWEVDSGRCRQTLLGHTDWVQSVAFSPAGDFLVSGSRDRSLKLWDVAAGTCIATLQGHENWVQSVTFSPAGQLLASASNDQTVKLWEVSTGTCIKTLQCSIQDIWSVAFSPDGRWLIVGGSDQTVQLWEVKTGKCVKTLRGHLNGILSMAFSPVCLPDSQGHGGASPEENGYTLVTGGCDRTLRLWNLTTEQSTLTLSGHTSWVRSVAASPCQNLLASGSSDHTIRLWDSSSGQCLKILQGHISWVRSVCFSPNGLTLASGSTDHSVRIWSVQTGECLHHLQGHSHWVRCVTFSPHPARPLVASCGDDQTIRLWDGTTGDCLRILAGHTSGIWSVAFSPDGQTLVSGGDDQVVKVWDVATGQCLQTLAGHTHWIQSVAFSPDGQWIASGSNDQTIRLWNAATGDCLHRMHSHYNRIWSVAFKPAIALSPEAPMELFSASEDGTIRVWDAVTGQCLKVLSVPGLCEGMNIWGTKGLTSAQGATLRVLGAVPMSYDWSEDLP
jgi:WD40 repeat protein